VLLLFVILFIYVPLWQCHFRGTRVSAVVGIFFFRLSVFCLFFCFVFLFYFFILCQIQQVDDPKGDPWKSEVRFLGEKKSKISRKKSKISMKLADLVSISKISIFDLQRRYDTIF